MTQERNEYGNLRRLSSIDKMIIAVEQHILELEQRFRPLRRRQIMKDPAWYLLERQLGTAYRELMNLNRIKRARFPRHREDTVENYWQEDTVGGYYKSTGRTRMQRWGNPP